MQLHFLQVLFGRRPFGEGMSQERVLNEGLILNASQVWYSQQDNVVNHIFQSCNIDMTLIIIIVAIMISYEYFPKTYV